VNAAVALAPINCVSGALQRMGRSLMSEQMSLPDFIREAWPIIEPARTFVPNWHIDLMAEYLTAVDLGQIKRLMINVPPRTGKSTIVSVLWPAWSWTERPWTRWVFASYAATLSTKLSIDRRAVIESGWYQDRWGTMFALAGDQNQKTEFSNTDRGTMITTSVGGSITGKGGDRIIMDDLINPDDAESKAARKAANEFYGKTLSTRLDEPKTGAIVGVMQRLHKNDLTGHIIDELKEQGWQVLKLPMEAKERQVMVFPVSGREVTRQPGELLCEARAGRKEVDSLKTTLGSRGTAAQLDQDPSDAEGMIFKREWWKFYREMPTVKGRTIWHWDTAAKDKQINDFWAGIRIAECADGYYVDRMVKLKMDYPTGKETLKTEYAARPSTILQVEDASTGQALIPDLRKDTRLPIIPFVADKDKVVRAHLVSPYCEAGKVYLPEGAPWVADFVENLAAFPDVEHDDDVDAFTGAMMRLTGKIGKDPGIITL
jgi:predicted phage terminase large subunit-like protein